MTSGASEKVMLRAGTRWFVVGGNTATATKPAGRRAKPAVTIGPVPAGKIPPNAVPGAGAPKGTIPGTVIAGGGAFNAPVAMVPANAAATRKSVSDSSVSSEKSLSGK